MSLELLGRIQQELSITGSAIYETIFALAERANRKVQVLRLHNQASSLLSQIEQAQGELGRQIAALCAKRPPFSHESTLPSDQLERFLGQAGDRVQQLKRTLLSVDNNIRELKLETIHHELLTLQQDLSLRAAAIERFSVVQGSPVIGRTLVDVALPASVRLVTVLRGPFLVPPDDALVLRVGDTLVMIGLQADLAQVASEFTQARNAKPV
ncbi:MAG TPA: TrkA C-terminal domain-containing protein [Nitrospiraceae bacterium]|jgi:K+/H+ antiporter YhaU regulatory subunit KhtT|nr:TrkA C-terminal domain-containing protein [Nitrospiraceae bacterium]